MEFLCIFDEKFQELIKDGVQTLNNIKENFVNNEETVEKDIQLSARNKTSNNFSCGYCTIEFSELSQQREHYKLDWHRYNLKRNILGKSSLTEQEFNEYTMKDDVSSISGSDTEDEEIVNTVAAAQGKIFLKTTTGKIVELYRCVIEDKKVEIVDSAPTTCLSEYSKNSQWTILMLGGGHFAGAVFIGNKPILHKTFHCYTVRAGQGSSQSTRDSQSGGSHPKSAGASLRRYNEMSLVQHVKDIIELWKLEIAKSSLIVIRAAGPYNKSVLFAGKNPLLVRNDPRIRVVPFSTRRATFAEVKRVHAVLTTATIYGSIDDIPKNPIQKASERETKRNKMKGNTINRAKSRDALDRALPAEMDQKSLDENLIINSLITSKQNTKKGNNGKKKEDEIQILTTEDVTVSFTECLENFSDSLTVSERNLTRKPRKSKNQKKREKEELRKREIYDSISDGDVEKLIGLLKVSQVDGHENNGNEVLNEKLTEDGNTLLHIAARCNKENVILYLLNSGANPCAKNSQQQTPYSCSQDKNTRDVFKRYAKENPDKFDYNKAQIPLVTISAEELAEKKRQQKKLKREKEKEKKKEKEVQRQEQQEQERFLKLSDREKRALAAERRILSQSGTVISRCFLCASDITGKVPFEYLGNRFCSVECLKAHRMQNPIVLSC